MIHDQTASVLALARNVLQGIDPSKIETPVNTASLQLLLGKLIELGSPAHPVADVSARTVAEHVNALRGKNG